MRKLLLTIVLCVLSLSISAQKKELANAKANLKSGKNLEQSENELRKLLLKSDNRNNEKIWLTLFDIIKKQYDQGNEKLYLKQNYDTAKIFLLTGKLFEVLEQYDSLDALPNKKGEVKPRYRKKHADLLNDYRPNLYNGGRFFVNKGQYKEGYKMFDMFIDCIHEPLFTSYDYENQAELLHEAAYWASYCAFKQKNFEAIRHHMTLALRDSVHYCSMLQILTETYKSENDTTRYIETLYEGFTKYPDELFFFRSLVDHLAQNADWKEIVKIANKGLQHDSTSIEFLFPKCSALLNIGNLKECIATGNKIISLNDTLPDVYYHVGLAYFTLATTLEEQIGRRTLKQKKEIKEYFDKARLYMEKYRTMEPDKVLQWSSPLYTIYLNLNMGKEFEEMDRLLKSKK